MDWLSLALGLVKLANYIMETVNERDLRDQGRREAFVDAITEMAGRLKISADLEAKIHAMSDQEAREKLKEDAR